MLVVPEAMPVTTPPVLIVAIEVAELLHVPVPTLPASARVVVDPGHTVYVPLMVPAAGDGLTVTTE